MSISEIPQIADKILNGQAIAFIGAGASLSANDPYTNKSCIGLLSAKGLVDELVKTKNYIEATHDFNQACFLLQKREGKQSLINFLSTHLNKNIEPLPTHKLLASLPFEAYISMNFDKLLENALEKEKIKYRRILKDSDVSLLQNDEITVIKPHGCFSNEKEIIASSDDELPFNQKFPLVDCFLKTKLANKTVLFIGFGLHDKDFEQLHQQLQLSLGALAPHSYAVSLKPSAYDKEYWENKKVKILDCDAGAFLKDIKAHINKQSATDIHDHEKDSWFSHPFFESLRDIKNLPTETQLIDAFLDKVLIETENNTYPIADLIKLGEEGRDKVYGKKSNFEAFKKAADEILAGLKSATDHNEAETFLNEYKDQREQITKQIQKKWNKVVSNNDNILLFSQSKRVSQVLSAASKAVQKTCKLYIAECRPKSPGHSFFQDSIETINKIGKVEYAETIFYPDIIVGHLFSEKKITKVIMGAHTIFTDASGNIKHFVNTAGSLVVSQLCEKYNIPLFVIAEKDKERDESYLSKSTISTTQEVELVDAKSNHILNELKLQGHDIQILNVGYDLVPAHTKTIYINER